MPLSSQTIKLVFTDAPELAKDLSAVLQVDKNLWLASDESTRLERLTQDNNDKHTFKDHQPFPLKQYITLPIDKDNEEVDIEGLSYDDHYLWLVGSHSLKRKKPDGDVLRLADVKAKGNRFMLARIPLVDGELHKEYQHTVSGKLKAAQLPGTNSNNILMDTLREDIHLGRFIVQPGNDKGIPGKDNGFDIEGLIVKGERVYLGLRGPVLRGWAIILELLIGVDDSGALKLKVTSNGQLYKKHFVHLGGLGIRELCTDGSDILILAGPTMDIDGPVVIYRWKDALNYNGENFIPAETISKQFDVPYGNGVDHAEGITIFNDTNIDGPTKILVVYDSPSEQRASSSGVIKADIFTIPPA